jgi:tRNA 2-thiouridine synthesizing protein A
MTGRRRGLFGRGSTPGRTDPGSAPVLAEFDTERLPVPSPPPAVPPPAVVLTIDALGRKCPIPIIMLAEQIRDIPLGAVVAVLADDPAAYTDIPSWCAMKAQEFVSYADLPRGWALYIRRRL